MTVSAPITERRYVVPLMLGTSLFFLWAIGVNLNDVLRSSISKRLHHPVRRVHPARNS